MNELQLEQTAEDYQSAGTAYGAAAFSQLIGAGIDWQAAKIQSSFNKSKAVMAETEAMQIKTQAVERANALRDQYISSAGNAIYGASQRNVSVTSGNVVSNIESSAKNLGEDINKLDKNASNAAKAKMIEANYYKTAGKLSGKLSLLSGLQGLVGSGLSASKAAKNWNKASSINDQNDTNKLISTGAYDIERVG